VGIVEIARSGVVLMVVAERFGPLPILIRAAR